MYPPCLLAVSGVGRCDALSSALWRLVWDSPRTIRGRRNSGREQAHSQSVPGISTPALQMVPGVSLATHRLSAQPHARLTFALSSCNPEHSNACVTPQKALPGSSWWDGRHASRFPGAPGSPTPAGPWPILFSKARC